MSAFAVPVESSPADRRRPTAATSTDRPTGGTMSSPRDRSSSRGVIRSEVVRVPGDARGPSGSYRSAGQPSRRPDWDIITSNLGTISERRPDDTEPQQRSLAAETNALPTDKTDEQTARVHKCNGLDEAGVANKPSALDCACLRSNS